MSSWLPFSLFFTYVSSDLFVSFFHVQGFYDRFLHTLFEIARDIQVKCIVKFWGMLAAQVLLLLPLGHNGAKHDRLRLLLLLLLRRLQSSLEHLDARQRSRRIGFGCVIVVVVVVVVVVGCRIIGACAAR